MKVSFPIEEVTISPNGRISITIEGDIEIRDIVDAFGIGELLDHIGAKECMNHFDLVEEKEMP